MADVDPWNVFKKHLMDKNLLVTQQRKTILDAFLSVNSHVSIDELFPIVRKTDPTIGHTTVFRTLKLLCECDIAQPVELDGRIRRYEPKIGHAHHDHLLCTKCGKVIESSDLEIEKLQERLCRKFGFSPQSHRLEIFGICKDCQHDATKRKK